MQLRALILLILALVMGAVTVFMVNSYLQREVGRRDVVETVETTTVVVARVDIAPGTRLTEELLRLVSWPADAVPEGSFDNIQALIRDTAQAPILLREARQGEPMLKYILSPYGARGGLPIKIPEDMRAITVAVNEINGVAGFILPGDYVDIIHTTKEGRADERLVTRVILQNTKVLGIDQISSESETEPRIVNAVTLLVSPFDGQRLALAQSLGQLTLLLRNDFDASLIDETVATYKDLLTIEKNRKTKIYKRVRRPKIEIIRGLKVNSEEIKDGAGAAAK